MKYLKESYELGKIGYEAGKIGYEAYLKDIGGISLISKAKLPSWDDLNQNIKDAWAASGLAIFNHLRDIQEKEKK